MTDPTTRFAAIPLERIVPNPDQPRVADDDDLAALTESIAEVGVLQPVIVLGDKTKPHVTLIAGHRRTEAARAAGLTTIPAVIVFDLDRGQQMERLMAENTARRDFTPLEKGRGYQTMLGLDVPVSRIAKVTGAGTDYVRKLSTAVTVLKDADLPAQVSFHELEIMAEYAHDPEAIAELTARIGSTDFDHRASGLKQEAKRKALVASLVAEVESEGAVLIAKGSWHYDYDGAAGKVDSDKAVPLSALELTENHASCPGHAAAIEPYGGRIEWFCMDPATYKHERKKMGNSAQPSADTAERDAAKAKLQAAVAAADEVRTAFIVKLCSAKEVPASVWSLVERIIRDDQRDLWLSTEYEDALEDLHGAGLAAAVILSSLDTMRVSWQGDLEPDQYDLVPLMDTLVAEGYTMAEVEQRAYDQAKAEAADSEGDDE